MNVKNGGRGGIIVNVASTLGLDILSFQPIYTATKHGVVGFTRSLGVNIIFTEQNYMNKLIFIGDYHLFQEPFFEQMYGIKFITVCPGATKTPLLRGPLNLYCDEATESSRKLMEVLPMQS